MTEPWVPVLLGDARMGDTVRVIASQVPPGNQWAYKTGSIVGFRYGLVTVRIGDASLGFEATQLERLSRPE